MSAGSTSPSAPPDAPDASDGSDASSGTDGPVAPDASAARARVVRLGRFLPAVLLVYAVCRVVTGVLLAVVASRQVPTGWNGSETDPVTYLTFTAQWDGQWYEQIARSGYPSSLPTDELGVTQQNAWAFYPLFPLLARFVMDGFGLSFYAAGSGLSLVLGAVAACAMALLLRDRLGPRAAVLVVAVWASFPAAAVLQVGYSESTAMALLTLVLLALSRERWGWAAGLALLTGLARPIALPLGVVVVVALWLRWRRRGSDPLRTGEVWAGVVALVACGVSGLLWPAIAWWGTGRADAYTDTMGAWRSGHEIHPVSPWVDMSRYYFGPTWGPVWLTTIFVVIAVMALGPWARRLGPQLRAWSLAYPGYLLVVLDPFTSVFRYLIPLFPLVAVLLGVAGPRRHRGAVAVRAVVLVALFTVGQWYWLDELWRFVPPSDYPP